MEELVRERYATDGWLAGQCHEPRIPATIPASAWAPSSFTRAGCSSSSAAGRPASAGGVSPAASSSWARPRRRPRGARWPRSAGSPCGVAGVAGVIDRIIRDESGRVRYHYVLVDYLAYPESDAICAGTDAAEARWVPPSDLHALNVTEGLSDMIRRAMALARGRIREDACRDRKFLQETTRGHGVPARAVRVAVARKALADLAVDARGRRPLRRGAAPSRDAGRARRAGREG